MTPLTSSHGPPRPRPGESVAPGPSTVPAGLRPGWRPLPRAVRASGPSSAWPNPRPEGHEPGLRSSDQERARDVPDTTLGDGLGSRAISQGISGRDASERTIRARFGGSRAADDVGFPRLATIGPPVVPELLSADRTESFNCIGRAACGKRLSRGPHGRTAGAGPSHHRRRSGREAAIRRTPPAPPTPVDGEWQSGFQDYALANQTRSRVHLPIDRCYVRAAYLH